MAPFFSYSSLSSPPFIIPFQPTLRIPTNAPAINHTSHLKPLSYRRFRALCSSSSDHPDSSSLDCIGTGTDVECVFVDKPPAPNSTKNLVEDTAQREWSPIAGDETATGVSIDAVEGLREWAVLISPFFFWGTAMVAMKGVIPKVGPFAVAAVRLIPAGALLVGFAAAKGRRMPEGLLAWLSIALFALVDGSCFQGFLAEGLERTSAGLGSVIIDSQPLTVAILAALLFGESIGYVGAAGLVLGVVGLLLLEVPAIPVDGNSFSLWGSGEWWMLLAAQSMAIGTVMVRWVSKYSDSVMATGWHMIIGGIPLLAISVLGHDPAFAGNLNDLNPSDFAALFYTSIFGSAISYGVFFYNATRGSLTKLSSLTFFTPMFASVFGYLYLGETFSNVQLFGAFVTLVAIYLVNYRSSSE
ncbi:WAT1-related protein [Drosera capensis]